MHAGLEPRIRTVPAPRAPKAVVDLRRMTYVEGVQLQGPGYFGGAGPVEYHHRFKGNSGPMMARDVGRTKNNMVLVGGNYRVSDEGMIEDNMAKHHFMRRASNPESTIVKLVLIGLAVGVTAILHDLVMSLLPASWNVSHKNLTKLGTDALLIAGGAMLFRRSPTWGIALAGVGVADAVQGAYVNFGLDQKIQGWLHRSPAAPRTFASVNINTDGSYAVTYSDGSPAATLPASTSPAPVVGMSGALGFSRGLPSGMPQRVPAGAWRRPVAV